MTEPEPRRAALSSFIDVRAGEGRPLLGATATLFGLVAAHSLLETARDALFLDQLPASRLPLVYLVVALVGFGLTDLNARFIRRFGRRNALVVTTTLLALGTAWLHFRPVTPGLAFGLYVWSALCASLGVVQFWLLAGEVFTSAQSKRFFPVISAGGVLGAVVGSALAVLLLWLLPVGSLLLAAAALSLGTAFLAASSSEPEVLAPRQRAPAPALGGSVGLLRRDGYVRRVALLVVSSTLALLALDYLFKSAAAAALPKQELGPFFARYYGALNTAALVVQLLVAGRMVRRFGIGAALVALPVCLALGAAGLVVLGGAFALLLLTKGADGALRHSIHRVGVELTYLPMDPERRDRAKPLIDSVIGRVAQALGAGGLFLLATYGLGSPTVLGALVAALSLVWLVAALAIRRPYLDLFRQSLGRGAGYAELSLSDLDLGPAQTVIEALSSPEPARALAAMNLLADARRTRLIPALILYHDQEEVLLRALEVVPDATREDWVPLARRLLEHPSERVATRAARALGRHGTLPEVASATGPLRAYLAVARLGRDRSADPAADPELCAMIAGTTPACHGARLALADAIADAGDRRFSPVVERLARDADGEVAEAALGALAALGSDESIPFLIETLADPRRRAAARRALVRFGDRALDALGIALTFDQLPERVRREIPRAIGELGSERAAGLLSDALVGELPGLVRYRVLRALGRLVRRNGVRVPRERLEPELLRNLEESLRLAALALVFEESGPAPERARPSDRLLRGLLADKQRQARERAFRILQMLYRSEDLRGVYFALESADKRVRANALELVEALTLRSSERLRDLLSWVVDDLSLRERVERSEARLPGRPRSLDAALGVMLGDSDDALATLAAYHVRALAVTDLDDEAAEVFSQRRWMPLDTDASALFGGRSDE